MFSIPDEWQLWIYRILVTHNFFFFLQKLCLWCITHDFWRNFWTRRFVIQKIYQFLNCHSIVTHFTTLSHTPPPSIEGNEWRNLVMAPMRESDICGWFEVRWIAETLYFPTHVESFLHLTFPTPSGPFNFLFLWVPWDPHQAYVFWGEEFGFGTRAWTHGYDFYSPHSNVISLCAQHFALRRYCWSLVTNESFENYLFF